MSGQASALRLLREHAKNADDLLRCADIAMYRAKTERGSFDIYDAALDDESRPLALIEDLRLAMADGSPRPALPAGGRPSDRPGGHGRGAPALAPSDPGPHPPRASSWPLAEESGLVHALAAWVFERGDCGLRQLVERRARGGGGSQPLGHRPLGFVPARACRRSSALAGLPFERWSSRSPKDGHGRRDPVKRVIQSLTDSGILVSIDDFGTGFSSLAHLNDLAVGELKLDRTFTSRLQVRRRRGPGRGHRPLHHPTRSRARAHVVAEGIERLDFVGVLAALGCDSGRASPSRPRARRPRSISPACPSPRPSLPVPRRPSDSSTPHPHAGG